MNLSHYRALAELFDYPRPGFQDRGQAAREFLAAHHPEAAREVEEFFDLLPDNDLRKTQELFTRSFDVQAITTLDMGYVMFGEDYKRGELLANLNREHLESGNDCRGELADHLPNLLRLLAILGDEDDKRELVGELVGEIVAPALRQMIGEFSPERLQQKNDLYQQHYKTLIETTGQNATAYVHALKALSGVLASDFSLPGGTRPRPLPEPSGVFLHSVTQEMEIESDEHAK